MSLLFRSTTLVVFASTTCIALLSQAQEVSLEASETSPEIVIKQPVEVELNEMPLSTSPAASRLGSSSLEEALPVTEIASTPITPERYWQIEVGTRALHISLRKDSQGEPHKGSFIGSINELDPNQVYTPHHPYVQALIPAGDLRMGVGITYDTLSVATVDHGAGDGDVEMDAWTLYFVLTYPNDSALTPFAEIGAALYRNDFDPIPSWYAGGRRNFVFDDSTAFHVATGCDYAFTDQLSANVYVRYVQLELDGEYVFKGDSRLPEPFVFPMDHLAYGFGLKYTF